MDYLDTEKTKRLLLWSMRKPQGPFKMDVELHRRCNLRCLTCSRRQAKDYEHINEFSKTIEMPLKKWLTIVDTASTMGVLEWHVAGGGDPPYVPELIFPVMERIKQRGGFGILTTNGTNLARDKLEFLVNIGWDRVHFSIDGPDEATHDYLRQMPDTFKRVTNAVRELNCIKESCGAQSPEVNMNTVLSIYNYKRLPELVELAHTLKVNYMFVEPLIVYSELGRKMKLQEKHLKEFKFYLKEAIRRANQYGIYSNFTTLETNLAPELIKKSSSMHEVIKKDAKKYDPDSFLSVPCYDPFFHMTIKADGRVISCDVATDAGENVKLHTLREIWWGHYFQNHREAMLNHQIPKFCRQCNPSHTTQRRWLREMMNSRIKSVKSLNPVV